MCITLCDYGALKNQPLADNTLQQCPCTPRHCAYMLLEAYFIFLEPSPYSAWSAWLLETLDIRWPEVTLSWFVGDHRALGISAVTVVIGSLPARLAVPGLRYFRMPELYSLRSLDA
jgi:hypothetical protein